MPKTAALCAGCVIALLGDTGHAQKGVRISEIARSDGRAVFAIDMPAEGISRRLTFSNATQKIKSISSAANRTRIAVIGETSAAEMVTILDTNLGTAIDAFYALNASVSPNGRWIAFQYFAGGGAPNSSAVYAVYDLARPPAANRFGSEQSEWGAGTPIYPERQRTGRTWAPVPNAEDHVSMSPLVWVSENEAGWIDRSGQDVRLVVLTLSNQAGEPVVRTGQIDADSVLDRSTVPADVDSARLLVAGSITTTSDADTFTVTFRPLPEVRRKSLQVRVW